MKFIAIVWATFLARISPVSTMAKPACMNMTRKPVKSVHIRLMAAAFLPEVSRNSVSQAMVSFWALSRGSGSFGDSSIVSGSFFDKSDSVAVASGFSPLGSGLASGFASSGFGSVAEAEGGSESCDQRMLT